MKILNIFLLISFWIGSSQALACDETTVRLAIKASLEQIFKPYPVKNLRITIPNMVRVPMATNYLVSFETLGKFIGGFNLDALTCRVDFKGATNTTDETGNF
jgi:hypothetical protein